MRLTFDPLNAYEVLEPLLDDYRKLRFKAMGPFSTRFPPSYTLTRAKQQTAPTQIGRAHV